MEKYFVTLKRVIKYKGRTIISTTSVTVNSPDTKVAKYDAETMLNDTRWRALKPISV